MNLPKTACCKEGLLDAETGDTEKAKGPSVGIFTTSVFDGMAYLRTICWNYQFHFAEVAQNQYMA